MHSIRWVQAFLLFTIFLVSIPIMINFWIDPYKIFNAPKIEGINKHQIINKDREANSYNLYSKQFDLIIMGTSRTLVSMNPSSKILNQYKVYNASMYSTNMFEQGKVLNFISEHQNNLKYLIYGVDFLTFSNKRLPKEKFYNSLYNNQITSIELISKMLLSSNMLNDSIRTVKKNMTGVENDYYIAGYNYKENKTVDHNMLFNKILTNNFLVSRYTYGCYEYGLDRLQIFKESINMFAKEDTKVILFISPMHVRQLIALDNLGLMPEYLNWIRDLAEIVGNINNTYNNSVQLWDFSGFNDITMEKIPENKNIQMKYYWESSHYKTKVGDMILKRILDKNEIQYDFGLQLNSINIEEHIDQFLIHKEGYYLHNPDEIEQIKKLYLDTQETRRKNCL